MVVLSGGVIRLALPPESVTIRDVARRAPATDGHVCRSELLHIFENGLTELLRKVRKRLEDTHPVGDRLAARGVLLERFTRHHDLARKTLDCDLLIVAIEQQVIDQRVGVILPN